MIRPTFTVVLGAFFLPVPLYGGLFRSQVMQHNALLNSSETLNSSSANLTQSTKAASKGLPGPYDPQEQRYLKSLRLMPHEFQRAIYLFSTMDKSRDGELSAAEFSEGLSKEAPAAASAGNYLYKPLVQAGSSMKPEQFYRFFALAITKPAEFAWQDGERSQLSEYFQDEKAKLVRLFITYDADCNDRVSESELKSGFNNTLLQTVRAAKIPVSDLFATEREIMFAEKDFGSFACLEDHHDGGQLTFIEFVKLGTEANRKAYAAEKSQSHQILLGCFTAFFLLFMSA